MLPEETPANSNRKHGLGSWFARVWSWLVITFLLLLGLISCEWSNQLVTWIYHQTPWGKEEARRIEKADRDRMEKVNTFWRDLEASKTYYRVVKRESVHIEGTEDDDRDYFQVIVLGLYRDHAGRFIDKRTAKLSDRQMVVFEIEEAKTFGADEQELYVKTSAGRMDILIRELEAKTSLSSEETRRLSAMKAARNTPVMMRTPGKGPTDLIKFGAQQYEPVQFPLPTRRSTLKGAAAS